MRRLAILCLQPLEIAFQYRAAGRWKAVRATQSAATHTIFAIGLDTWRSGSRSTRN